MSVFSIQNWRFGLDTRRSELTSQPGTLETLQNAHINQGAEIEKRKAFVQLGAFSANVFGLEASSGSLVAFGSAAVGAVTVPAGVTYIQCIHPTDTTQSMTSVVCSCEFGGKAFCIAQFTDGNYFWFLNGTIIPSSIAGQVFTSNYAQGVLTGSSTTNVSDGDTVTIGTRVYRFKNTMALAYDVKIAGSGNSDGSLNNLIAAINGTGVAGTNWYTGTKANLQVSAGALTNHGFTITTLSGSTVGTIATTETSSVLSWGATTLNTSVSQVQSISQITGQLYQTLSGPAFVAAGISVSNLTNNSFQVSTAYGVTWKPVVSVTSASGGVLSVSFLSSGQAPVAAGTGAGILTLYAGTNGSISSLIDVANVQYPLLKTAIPFTTNVSKLILDLSNGIVSQNASPALGVTTSNSGGTLSIMTSLTTLPSNSLQYTVTGDLCFENLSLDFSNVPSGTPVSNIYTTAGVSQIPSGSTYAGNGSISGSPSGSDPGYKAFELPYGSYLWIPGTNDTKLVVSVNGAGSSTTFFASDYPQGVAIQNWSRGYFNLWGKANSPVTAKLIVATDILNSSKTFTTAASLATIAAQIVTNNNGWVASNTDVSGTVGLVLYLSRKTLNLTATNQSDIYIYTTIPGISPAGFSNIVPYSSYGIGQATAAVTGSGDTYLVAFTHNWSAGDQYVFDIVTPAVTYTVGVGNITGVVPSACITLSDRVLVVAGSYWLGSDNGDATQWEQQAAGAFSINVSQQFRQADQLISLAAYQGRVALFANYVIMIWSIDANPNNIAMVQAMGNIGTFCPLGPQSLGDFDVVFPCVTGFRSLRVRDLSLNAYVNDLGSPVDLLVQTDINSVGLGNLASSCGIVEPSANRYWLYLNGKIYVLSYFPSAKINAAWSVYTPTFVSQGSALGGGSGTVNVTIGNLYYYSGTGTVSTTGGQLIQSGTGYFISSVSQVVTAGAGTLYNASKTTFVPIKFVIYNSQVYFLASYGGTNYLLVFGGTNNTTYDGTLATVATPWLDMGSPTFRKVLTSLDFAMTNSWQFFWSMDYYGYVNKGGQLRAVTAIPVNSPSYQLGSYAISEDGYHVKLQATCSAVGYSVLSALELNYQKREEKK